MAFAGLADNKPTQVASRSESNAPWAPEANEFERKSILPQIALGMELKKKKEQKTSRSVYGVLCAGSRRGCCGSAVLETLASGHILG